MCVFFIVVAMNVNWFLLVIVMMVFFLSTNELVYSRIVNLSNSTTSSRFKSTHFHDDGGGDFRHKGKFTAEELINTIYQHVVTGDVDLDICKAGKIYFLFSLISFVILLKSLFLFLQRESRGILRFREGNTGG